MTTRSGGPRTRRGKQVARRNALKHGLTARVLRADHEDRIEELARQYAQGSKNPKRQRLARQAAEARVFVEQVETARAQTHCSMAAIIERAPSLTPSEALALAYDAKAVSGLCNFKPYEQAAYAKWRKAVRKLEEIDER